MEFICILYVLVLTIRFAMSLTGHVCSVQKQETYMTSYDRAFVCPERYTTACGQLDWRRCTKYRVSTCYTPTEKYATRYRTVDDCCPGWIDAGGGSCTQPVCAGQCQNGGRCAAVDSVPGCQCLDGYHGDLCQNARNTVETLAVVVSCIGLIVVGVVTGLTILVCKRTKTCYNSRTSGSKCSGDHEMKSLLDSTYNADCHDNTDSHPATYTDDRLKPSAPLED